MNTYNNQEIKTELRRLARNPLTQCIENDALAYIEFLEKRYEMILKVSQQNSSIGEFMDGFDQGFMACLRDISNDLEKYIERCKLRIEDYQSVTKNMPTGKAQDDREKGNDNAR